MSVFKKGTLLMPTGAVKHLHIVMTDPIHFPELGYEEVLLVNISSIKANQPHDTSCTLSAGEHPFIKHDSYVYYKDAAIFRVPNIVERMQLGEIATYPPISDAVYAKVLAGFAVSKFVKQKIKRFVEKYT